MSQQWSVIECNSHRLAGESLKKLGIEAFLPEYVLRVRKGGRKKELQRKPLLYGYGFIHIDLKRDPWREVFHQRGIEGLICSAGVPKSVPDDQVEHVRVIAAEYDDIVCEEVPFTLHQVVKIIEGPFTSFPGTIEAIDRNGDIKLDVQIFGRPTPVLLPRDAVAPIE
jgi:transcription termination/antitermination protein NusG